MEAIPIELFISAVANPAQCVPWDQEELSLYVWGGVASLSLSATSLCLNVLRSACDVAIALSTIAILIFSLPKLISQACSDPTKV